MNPARIRAGRAAWAPLLSPERLYAHNAIGEHGLIGCQPCDDFRDDLADDASAVCGGGTVAALPDVFTVHKRWGVIILDKLDAWVAYEMYFTFVGPSGKKRVAVITKRGSGPRKAMSLAKFLLSPAPGLVVDHINGDVFDNRRANLRCCTITQNNWNRKRRKGGASRFKGVSRDHNTRSRWMSMIARPGGGNIYLGSFINEEDAARAYDVAARARYGEFAAVNFPGEGERCAALSLNPFIHSATNSQRRQHNHA